MSKDTSTVCIIGAMDAEIEQFLKHAQVTNEIAWNEFIFREAKLFNKDVVIVKSGVGKVYAVMICERLIDEFNPTEHPAIVAKMIKFNPTDVIFTGMGGALNRELQIGDVVISNDCIQHDLDAEALGFPRGEIPYSEHKIFLADTNLKKYAL